MRKISAALILTCLLSSCLWGAEVDNYNDIYVRKDVYQSDLKNINEKLDKLDQKLDSVLGDIQKLTQSVFVLSERIEGVNKSLSEKIDGVNNSLNEKIDGLDKHLNEKIDGINNSLNGKIDGLDKRLTEKIDGVNNSLSAKIDGVDKRLSEKIDGVDKKLSARMDDLRNGLYLVLTLIALIISLPFVRTWYEERAKQKIEARKPSFTLDDVKKLIEENNALLLTKIQGGVI